jgi:hypothetical protein
MPLIALAVPVVHSSGAWIASTSAGGYLAGTLSSTWIGSFIAGNSGILGSMGLVSAAGVFGSTGVLAGLGSSAAAGLGTALTSVGLGGLATKLGLAPALFLGLTPTGWAIVGAGTTVTAGLGAVFTRFKLKKINEERAKGGLEAISVRQLISEIKAEEERAMEDILKKFSQNPAFSIKYIDDRKNVVINDYSYSVKKLKYVVDPDGAERLVLSRRLGKAKTILKIVGPHPFEGAEGAI